MLLAIDVGNTNVKLGVFDGERMVASWRIRTARERTADEYGAETIELLLQRRIEPSALFAAAPRLRAVEMVPPQSPIGRSTVEALQSGIVCGFAGLADGLVARFRRLVGEGATVIATRGLAHVIQPVTETIKAMDPDLT